MTSAHTILESLKLTGARMTRLRVALVGLFCDDITPVDYGVIANYLLSQGIIVNKTTIYRELEYLLEHNVIQEVDLGERKKRYELVGHHHHHLICTGCEAVEAVHLDDHLHDHELRILKEKKFKVTRHMLEFFGLCGMCQKKGS
ncbi:MAG TPA: transcriptional repressor [Patescibacteria group bacterium]